MHIAILGLGAMGGVAYQCHTLAHSDLLNTVEHDPYIYSLQARQTNLGRLRAQLLRSYNLNYSGKNLTFCGKNLTFRGTLRETSQHHLRFN
ncbi:MAG: hypothetical protein V4495_18790 [Pseudomonadota bacterium]